VQSELRKLFDACVDLPPIERAKFLRDIQFKSPIQYRDLRDLLIAHEGPSAFFEQDGGVFAHMKPVDLTGRRFGAYSIVREIGQGGMGTVYEATRVDDAFDKTVAIKLISVMVLSDAFRRERQILAQLDHPHIARLLDGGATDDGMPYLVMEYVDGLPIDQYIEQHRLGVEEILRLFIQVMEAVAFAHRNLIVHRDLKPSNILVTKTGQAKLLDFGIAKVLKAQGDETATLSVRLTPEFASPEQIQGGAISTASDVYSLGVLLFHTLTSGERPYRVTSGSISDMMQAVVSSATPRPSLVAPPKFRKKLKGDLDNIILKAMAKEPERRYASVDQLREDIERHLSGRPVLAQGDKWTYRARKFITRHRYGVGAGALILLSIITGVLTTLEQRAAAESRYQNVRSLATSILFDVNQSLKDVPGAAPARRKAVMAAVKHLEDLAARSGDDPSLIEDLATAYEQAAEMEEDLITRAVALREKLAPSEKLANAQRRLGNSQLKKGEMAQAMASYRKSMRTAEQVKSESAIGLAHSNLCTALAMEGKYQEAVGQCWAAVGILKGMDRVLAQVRYGAVLEKLGQQAAANQTWQQAAQALNPLDAMAWGVIGELWASVDHLPRVKAVLAWKRGLIEAERGDRDRSLESFEQAVKLVSGPNVSMKQVVAFADACALYGEALKHAGQKEYWAQQALIRLNQTTVGAQSLLRAELQP
jgi:serine/threonine protein kinase/tetratricopeptide (TPR) repeat protein